MVGNGQKVFRASPRFLIKGVDHPKWSSAFLVTTPLIKKVRAHNKYLVVLFLAGALYGGKLLHLFALGVPLASQTLNQRDELGVPGVAQEGSRVVSQGALAALSGNTYVVECFLCRLFLVRVWSKRAGMKLRRLRPYLVPSSFQGGVWRGPFGWERVFKKSARFGREKLSFI